MDRAAPEIPGILESGNVTQDLKMIVSKLLNSPKPLKTFPGSQPVSFQHSDMKEKLSSHDYYVCEKTDGLRVLMLIVINPMTKEQSTFMIDRENNYYLVNGFHFPKLPKKDKKELIETAQDGTLIDGELVIQTNPMTNLTELRYLMFDCLTMNGRNLTHSPTSSRLAHLGKEFYKPYFDMRSIFPDRCINFPFKISMKQMNFSYDLVNVYKTLDKLPHLSDGLIFTPVNTPYVVGAKDSYLLKWKPEEENSVDFKLILQIPMVEDTSLPRKDPNRWYYNYDTKPTFELYVWQGGSDVNRKLEVFDQPFNKKEMNLLENTYRKFTDLEISDEKWEELKALNEPLNGRIVECTKDPETDEWLMLRFRDDKLNGNHSSVVQNVLESINDSVKIEDLTEIVPIIKNNWDLRKNRHSNESSTSHAHINNRTQHQQQQNSSSSMPEPKYVDDDDWSE
ncbi:hypothetical protein TPHA_0E02770 [Tetrapisispora phaffii CBS 4417]|uniref:mRNA-capping enzyme subunit alpha n=1 Tax=Tetrapisispora phaffii (strain ATCC 24235 / CBS 4417 / NBRC 1672 / NRRL Y-8282 / UCD 70-5) TaxID=1071381 RepID=G8BTY9_TETPH|nr:hypothetical protein TPHA_0E02770 [Tetrapisispora phaffii CBS 4417]CCE63367.1 hypothetical protein TPHA_0E02770 [Tetrapisispora phaffii CBS 4417]